MDGDAAAPLAVIDPQAADPADELRRSRRGQSRGRDPRAEADEACRPGSRWPYQVRRRPMATSTLTTGSSR